MIAVKGFKHVFRMSLVPGTLVLGVPVCSRKTSTTLTWLDVLTLSMIPAIKRLMEKEPENQIMPHRGFQS